MKKKNKVYVAGPYTFGGTLKNVIKAIDVADQLSKQGYTPFIPHLNHFWNFYHSHPESFWYKWDNEWLECCDYIYRIPGKSPGTDKEMKLAKKLGIPVLKLNIKNAQ